MSNHNDQQYAYAFEFFLAAIGKEPQWVLLRAEILQQAYLLVSKDRCVALDTFVSELQQQCSGSWLTETKVDCEWSDVSRCNWEQQVLEENYDEPEGDLSGFDLELENLDLLQRELNVLWLDKAAVVKTAYFVIYAYEHKLNAEGND